MENRLRKLQMDDDRMQRQIHIANKHTHFANEVASRRSYDLTVKTQQEDYW